jgi:crooked neck
MALDNGSLQNRRIACRSQFEKINKFCKENDKSSDRVVLFETWLDFEKEHGDLEFVEKINARLPKTVKKRKRITDADGNLAWEEYYDYVFPEDGETNSNVKLLEMAHAWKNKIGAEDSDDDSDEDSD